MSKKKRPPKRSSTIPSALLNTAYSEAGRFSRLGLSYPMALCRFIKENPQWDENAILTVFPAAWRVNSNLADECLI